jgi:hypothetical protein
MSLFDLSRLFLFGSGNQNLDGEGRVADGY